LANQIISDLTYLEDYSVCPAGSIRKYVTQIIDPVAIGRELEVDYIICGYYLLENKIIRLNIEMIEVNNNQLVWREQMQVDYSDTFSLQDMVAQKVAKALDVGFSQNFLNQQHRDIPNSALAFEFYLRGISYPQSNEGHKLAVQMLQKAIEMDPQYAPSYAYLGFHLRLLEQHGRIIIKESKDTEWYYKRALELNPHHLEALSNLSGYYAETNRIEEAVVIAQKMLEINPNDANSYFSLGYIYRYAGMLDESIEAMETALSMSPNNTRFRSIISTYVSAGKYAEALNKIYLDNGDYGLGYSGVIAFEQKKYALSKKRFNEVIGIDENGIWELIARVYLAVMDDNREQGLRALAKMVDSGIIDAENMFYFASFYALFNKKERCLDMLEKAINSGYFNYPHIIGNSTFKFIQNDVRFIDIISRAKLRHDAFRKKFL
jgi:tetratricopeptide (TPR) repeat protein